jgi:DNA polymerase I
VSVKDNNIFLIDGTGLVYRAYYAFITRPLTTTSGQNTSAIFGFFKIIFQIIRDFKPDHLAIAFDLSRDTFRKDIYPEYKAHREETPADLKSQIPLIIELLEMMEIPVLEKEGFEADDIIGTLAEQYKKDNKIYIVSSDKDLLQLVDDNVEAIRPQKGISEINIVKKENVREILGVAPEQIPDYLAITGDTSDNIPGVKGIGDKGAVQLLSVYKSLEDIYQHIDDIKGAAQKKLIESKDNAFLSKNLATIVRDMDIDPSFLNMPLSIEKFLSKNAVSRLEHYQLQSLINDIKKMIRPETEIKPAAAPAPAAAPERNLFPEEEMKPVKTENLRGNYFLINKKADLLKLMERIKAGKILSLDTETTSVNCIEACLIGISMSIEEGEGYFIPVLYDTPRDFDAGYVMEQIKPVLEDPSIKKIGQNSKYEMEIFHNSGIRLKGNYFDTMLAAYLLNPTRTHNNLESLIQEYLGLSKKDYKEVMKNVVKKDKTLLDVPIEEVVTYACGDSDGTLRLYHKLEPMIKERKLEDVFYRIEIPLVSVLAVMEENGVKIDTDRLSAFSKELDETMVKTEEKIYEIAGKKFNINSPVQLSKILFEDMGLDPVKKTEGGKYSTDEEVLSILAVSHSLPDEILKYRTYSKLKGTYADALPELVSQKTGRIHTSFNQTVTATGRLSSSDPNLQNIPVRDEIGQKIREAFVAEKGNILISADYSQIELRVLAHFCRDEAMVHAFSENLDIHRHTASIIFNVPEDSVTDDMRRRAKTVNFGIIYGQQAYGLSRQLGITMTEAKLFIQSYFENFPKVKVFVEKALIEAKDTGEVRTISGRYRKFPDLLGKEIKDVNHMSTSQRMALNAKLQGTAADIIKVAMVRIQDYIEVNEMKSRLILQIHDELVVESPLNESEIMKKALKDIMENAWKLTVPLTVEVGTGHSWREAH